MGTVDLMERRYNILGYLKDSHPIEVAEYSVANKIVEQPAFAWWAKQALQKRDRHIKKAKSCYWKRMHKFGVELPKSVAEAYAIDCRNASNMLSQRKCLTYVQSLILLMMMSSQHSGSLLVSI
jgi:hypothetical protein